MYLSREYNETHLNSQELVSSEYKSETNKKYYDREQIRMVDDVIYTLPDYTANRLKKENVSAKPTYIVLQIINP